MRIAIVNPAAHAVEAICRAICSVDGYRIVWTASNGAEAVAKCRAERPDVLLMELLTPADDGMETIRRIMRETPCAVLVVTPTISGQAAGVFEAMGCGALDAVATPVIGAGGQIHGGADLLRKIGAIGRLVGNPRGAGRAIGSAAGRPGCRALPPLVAIGASTGGPKALSVVLSAIPPDLGAAVMVAQHVDAHLAEGLAEWLCHQSRLTVVVARENARLEPNMVFVAGTRDHLVLGEEGSLHYSPEPRECPFRPSVDVLFASLAACGPSRGVAVLLTGMGTDGARGLLTLRQSGWNTIAQDQRTSVIYGMPKAAAEMNAAAEIVPLPGIAGRIVAHVKGRNVPW